jgi:benzodiazapine receptor
MKDELTFRPFTSSAKADSAMQLYYAQLGLNLLWSPIFFGSKSPKLALANIVALTATAAKWALESADLHTAPISPNWFTIPYLAWLSYAAYLNTGYVAYGCDNSILDWY